MSANEQQSTVESPALAAGDKYCNSLLNSEGQIRVGTGILSSGNKDMLPPGDKIPPPRRAERSCVQALKDAQVGLEKFSQISQIGSLPAHNSENISEVSEETKAAIWAALPTQPPEPVVKSPRLDLLHNYHDEEQCNHAHHQYPQARGAISDSYRQEIYMLAELYILQHYKQSKLNKDARLWVVYIDRLDDQNTRVTGPCPNPCNYKRANEFLRKQVTGMKQQGAPSATADRMLYLLKDTKSKKQALLMIIGRHSLTDCHVFFSTCDI